MMQLLQSWKESLAIFWPSNFKVLLLVTLKAIMQVMVPLCVLAAIMSVLMFFNVMVFGLDFVLVILLALLLRPSIAVKTVGYVAGYWKHLLYLIVLYVAYVVIRVVVSSYSMLAAAVFLQDAPTWLALSIVLIFALVGIILNLVETLYILFFLDTHGTLRDILPVLGRALRMVVYLLPAFLIIYVGMEFVTDILVYCAAQILVWTSLARFAVAELFFIVFEMLISFIQLVLTMGLFITLYTKQVHEHFNRYFPQEGGR